MGAPVADRPAEREGMQWARTVAHITRDRGPGIAVADSLPAQNCFRFHNQQRITPIAEPSTCRSASLRRGRGCRRCSTTNCWRRQRFSAISSAFGRASWMSSGGAAGGLRAPCLRTYDQASREIVRRRLPSLDHRAAPPIGKAASISLAILFSDDAPASTSARVPCGSAKIKPGSVASLCSIDARLSNWFLISWVRTAGSIIVYPHFSSEAGSMRSTFRQHRPNREDTPSVCIPS